MTTAKKESSKVGTKVLFQDSEQYHLGIQDDLVNDFQTVLACGMQIEVGSFCI